MNWLKVEEIKAAAKAGKRPAIIMSIEHHKQIMVASNEELEKEIFASRRRQNVVPSFCATVISGNYCALCPRYSYSKTRKCPLINKKCRGQRCCLEWAKVNIAFENWVSKGFKPQHLSAIRKAEAKLIAKLEGLL